MRKDPQLRRDGRAGQSDLAGDDDARRPGPSAQGRPGPPGVSLAIDRKAINDAELGGMSLDRRQLDPAGLAGGARPPGAAHRHREGEAAAGRGRVRRTASRSRRSPRCRRTPRGASGWSRQLRAINIKTTVNTMERGAFYDADGAWPEPPEGPDHPMFSGAPGDAASPHQGERRHRWHVLGIVASRRSTTG